MADSTCDLPPAWVERYDIRVVPTFVQFGQESLADDGHQLTRAGFYERIVDTAVYPTTAAPPLGLTRSIMQQALADADHVIVWTAPARLSGIFNVFRLAAEQTDPERVTLLDSGMLSMGIGWQIVAAAELRAAGAAVREIVAANEQLQPYTDVWAALDTMQNLRRSGRVSWATAMVGNLLNIKPVIRFHDSTVSLIKRVRTRRSMFDTLVNLAYANAPLERLAVMHTSNLAGAQRLLETLQPIHPAHEPVIVEATPVIGVHVGPNGLGLAVVRQS